MAKPQIFNLAAGCKLTLIGCEPGKTKRTTTYRLTIVEHGDFNAPGNGVGPANRDDISPARRLMELYDHAVYKVSPPNGIVRDPTQVKNGQGEKNVTKCLCEYEFDDLQRAVQNVAKETRITRTFAKRCANFFGREKPFLAYLDPEWEAPKAEHVGAMPSSPKDTEVDPTPMPAREVLQSASEWKNTLLAILRDKHQEADYISILEKIECRGMEIQAHRKILHFYVANDMQKSQASKLLKYRIQNEYNDNSPIGEKPCFAAFHVRP